MTRWKKAFKKIKAKNIAFDILQYIVIWAIILGYLAAVDNILPYKDIKPISDEVNRHFAEYGELPDLSGDMLAKVEKSISMSKAFMGKLVLFSIIAYILIILVSSVFRGLVYKPGNWKKFLIKNSIWLIFWTSIIYIAGAFLRPGGIVALFPIGLVLYMHLSVIIRCSHDKTLKKTWERIVDTGFKRIPDFLIALIIIAGVIIGFLITTLFILPLLSGLVTYYAPKLSAIFAGILLIIALLMFFTIISWARAYYIITQKEVER